MILNENLIVLLIRSSDRCVLKNLTYIIEYPNYLVSLVTVENVKHFLVLPFLEDNS